MYPLSLLKLSQFPPQSCPLPLKLYLPLLSLLCQIGFYSNSSDYSFLFLSFIFILFAGLSFVFALQKHLQVGTLFFPLDLSIGLFALVNSVVPTPCMGMLTTILKRRLPLLNDACTTYATPPSSPSMQYFLG